MEDWRREWRIIAPSLPTDGLERLRDALLRNSSRLARGCYIRWGMDGDKMAPTGACAISMCFWAGRNFNAASKEFADMIRDRFVMPLADIAPKFVLWFDTHHSRDYNPPSKCAMGEVVLDAPSRLMVFRELLPEVSRELALRNNQETDHGLVAEGVAGADSTQPVAEGS